MKAAVIDRAGATPQYRDIPEPEPRGGEIVLTVEAVAVENVDRAIAAGTHYTAGQFLAALPAVPCFDGIGRRSDGTLVGFGGLTPPHGALAERVAVAERFTVPIPEGIAPEQAAALSSAMSAMTMQTAGGLTAGETVLVQGATGVAGRLAVRVARLLGAGRIVASGRDDAALEEVRALGADETINTAVGDDELVRAYREHVGDGYHVVADYLWGRPTELLARALTPETFAMPATPTRLVQIGESAGPSIGLPADALRTSGLEVYGAGRNAAGMPNAYTRVVDWVRGGELEIAVTTAPLSSITEAWRDGAPRGRRLVVVPD